MKAKKIQNTKEKEKHKEQTNKETGLVTRKNYQTQYLRSANMTAKEVGVGWGGVGGT